MSETINKPKQRIAWVDYAKGITIILVVLLHSTSEEFKYTPITELNNLLEPFRIPFFFFIAGLFIKKSLHSDLKVFLKSKVAHFLYIFVLWSVIKYFVDTIPRYFIYDNTVNLKGILYIFVNPPSTLWFIYALLVFFIIARITRSFTLVMFLISVVLYMISVQLGNDLFIDRIARYLPFFLLGSLTSKKVIVAAKQIKTYHILIPIIFVLIVSQLQSYHFIQIAPIKFLLSISGIVCGIIIANLLTNIRLFSFLNYIGERTLIIYVMHFLPLNVMKLLLPRVIPDLPTLSVMLTLLVGITIPLIVERIVKKLNIHWLFQLPKLSSK